MIHYLPLMLTIDSLILLFLGFFAWRLTSSRGMMANGVFASAGLLYAAYEALARNRPEWCFILPFFVTMLFGGRAAGLWWRSRKESALLRPAQLLAAGAALALVAAVSGYMSC